MNRQEADPRIFTIPPGVSFVDALAQGLLNQARDESYSLPQHLILFPTRRACRSLREGFLRQNKGKPLLLPRMHPIGDVDEDDLFLTLAASGLHLDLPPALHPIRRRFLLMRLVKAKNSALSLDHIMALADALARLMDQVYTEDLDLKNLPEAIESQEFSEHWQISLDFLSMLSQYWPSILVEEGVIDAADRRNQLIKHLASLWHEKPPPYPVIAAGSTGSIPATAQLLKTIAGLPKGMVILPGLDTILDDESWSYLPQTHPQATLSHLLSVIGIHRKDVRIWPVQDTRTAAQHVRAKLISEVMRPAQTTIQWQSLSKDHFQSFDNLGLERYDCATPQEEAMVICMGIVRALQDKNQTVAVVTPDRMLARRVCSLIRRWGIDLDDSAGTPLTLTSTGQFLLLCLKAVTHSMRPVPLMDLCKHPLCAPAQSPHWNTAITVLDKDYLRGLYPSTNLNSFRDSIALKNPDPSVLEALDILINSIELFSRLEKDGDYHSFKDWITPHIHMAELLSVPNRLWGDDQGEALFDFLTNCADNIDPQLRMSLSEYESLLTRMMEADVFRPSFGKHPRVSILGQLEARLVEHDVIIAGSVNEGSWPPEASIDPWMSRPMRKKFGLPSLERSIGLSAHDFSQIFCGKKVVLTRAIRVEGEPTTPSRWLLRLQTVLKASGLETQTGFTLHGPLLTYAQAISIPHTTFNPVDIPAPNPPISVRPRSLSVTDIERWINDPYALYAKHILRLKSLKKLDKPFEASDYGSVLHDVLRDFVDQYADDIPLYADDLLLNMIDEALRKLGVPEETLLVLAAKHQKMARWFIQQESTLRETYAPAMGLREVTGEHTLANITPPFYLRGRVDRIDIARTGMYAQIIDYKSSEAGYSAAKIKRGEKPQLSLEGILVQEGGFKSLKKYPVHNLVYCIVNGSKDGGKIVSCSDEEAQEAISTANQILYDLITLYDHPLTAYRCLAEKRDKHHYNEYAHLERIQEWSDLEDEGLDS